MRALTSVRTGVRAAAGSWKRGPLAVACMDGARRLAQSGGWSSACLTLSSAVVTLSLTTATFSVYRNEPGAAAAFYIRQQQVCIRWHRTGACYRDKLTFSHGFSIKVWGAYYTNMRIIFEFLRYSIHGLPA